MNTLSGLARSHGTVQAFVWEDRALVLSERKKRLAASVVAEYADIQPTTAGIIEAAYDRGLSVSVTGKPGDGLVVVGRVSVYVGAGRMKDSIEDSSRIRLDKVKVRHLDFVETTPTEAIATCFRLARSTDDRDDWLLTYGAEWTCVNRSQVVRWWLSTGELPSVHGVYRTRGEAKEAAASANASGDNPNAKGIDRKAELLGEDLPKPVKEPHRCSQCGKVKQMLPHRRICDACKATINAAESASRVGPVADCAL